MPRQGKLRLSFEDLPNFASTPVWLSLPDDVDARLRELPNTYARCAAGLRFTGQIGADARQMGVRDDEVSGMRVAYLRAALMEYVGMEEVLPSDLRGRAQTSALSIWETEHPMLVLMRELRNVQVHLVSAGLVDEPRSAYLPARPDHTVALTAHIVPPEDLRSLRTSKNARRFDSADMQRAVEWLDSAQRHWGIQDVLLRSIWAYASRIVSKHVAPSV